MIKIIQKNLFDSKAEVIAHQVNVNGVMGGGVAKEVKERFPNGYRYYHTVCEKFPPNQLLGYTLDFKINQFQAISNLFAEDLNVVFDNNRLTNYDALRRCFRLLNQKGKSVAIPYKIGCGLGGGEWSVILPMIKEELANVDVEICSLDPVELSEFERKILEEQ